MTAFVCVHGHAYQPPREDPVTGEVPVQPGAEPFHDWNGRISAECYAPLAAARRLGEHGVEVSRTNLWSRVNFDLGPTLGVWFDRHRPDIAEAVRQGDSLGRGAMAHPWVHAILPLTPERDRATVLRWGNADFRARFGREPEGVWFPETAVDSASLEAAADAGLSWTVVAPHQVRARDQGAPPSAASPHYPVRIVLPSGRPFVLVPYDGEVSHAVAFGDLLRDGVALANRVTSAAEFALRSARSGDTVDIPPLVIVSTDIETFGHHHRFGEMALARAMDEWDAHGGLRRCVVADYLDEVGVHRDGWLVERTAWSCGHGVERWRSECGCRFESGTSQSWRRPLRDVLDAVDDAARRIMEGEADRDLVDPWAARDDYGTVLAASGTPSSGQVRASFLASHAASGADPQRVWAWMEAERLRLEAWSSCAWFFDTADRIETRQTVHQATEAVRRLSALGGVDLREWLDGQWRDHGLGDEEVSRPSE